ncbi:MAG TPA: hypothetical protein VI461_01410, partial [Chitinophagaceae bacterium]|nr:hypothetical protein [Chitinophagaceae bacterium]
MNQIKITHQIRWSKMFPVRIVRKFLVMGLAIFLIFPVMAQREKGESLITREQISKINELVKPLVDQLDKQLRDDETYKAYVQDITALNNTKSFDEKSALTKKVNEKYRDYFQKVWAGANVDERAYQLRIRQVFPDDISRLIQFESFLVFTLNFSTVTTPTEPPPPDKCLDICPMTTGEITGTGALIAGSGGSYGNCFLRTNAWSAVMGGNQLFGYLRNNVTIPGTLPADSRKLRVLKKYELMQEATSFAVLGGGYAETKAKTYKTSEYMLVYSPVIFGASAIKIKSMSENYLLEKKDVAFSIFKTYAQTFSAFISGNWCYSNCFAIRWSI